MVHAGVLVVTWPLTGCLLKLSMPLHVYLPTWTRVRTALQACLDSYKQQLVGDPIIHTHLTALYGKKAACWSRGQLWVEQCVICVWGPLGP